MRKISELYRAYKVQKSIGDSRLFREIVDEAVEEAFTGCNTQNSSCIEPRFIAQKELYERILSLAMNADNLTTNKHLTL